MHTQTDKYTHRHIFQLTSAPAQPQQYTHKHKLYTNNQNKTLHPGTTHLSLYYTHSNTYNHPQTKHIHLNLIIIIKKKMPSFTMKYLLQCYSHFLEIYSNIHTTHYYEIKISAHQATCPDKLISHHSTITHTYNTHQNPFIYSIIT